jgi:divalent metal cation (Fe/Co/Zn/Cd) transporter
VGEVRSVRVREAGGETFADVVIGVSRLEGLERSHDTMDAVERAVEQRVGRAHVTVHAEPFAAGERASERIAAAALRVAGVMEVHNVVVLDDGGAPSITLHARVADTLTLAAADDAVERLRSEIADEYGVSHVYVHVEPFSPEPRPARDVTADEPQLRGLALAAVRRVAGGAQELRLFRQEGRLLVITAVAADPALSVRQGHALASRVEDAVRDALPDVDDVIVEVTRR